MTNAKKLVVALTGLCLSLNCAGQVTDLQIRIDSRNQTYIDSGFAPDLSQLEKVRAQSYYQCLSPTAKTIINSNLAKYGTTTFWNLEPTKKYVVDSAYVAYNFDDDLASFLAQCLNFICRQNNLQMNFVTGSASADSLKSGTVATSDHDILILLSDGMISGCPSNCKFQVKLQVSKRANNSFLLSDFVTATAGSHHPMADSDIMWEPIPGNRLSSLMHSAARNLTEKIILLLLAEFPKSGMRDKMN